jgi:Secretion system C-terminal sorting domain
MKTKNIKQLLILSLLIIQYTVFSQASVYKPFCKNPSWVILSSNFNGLNYNTFSYQSDTTIGMYTYKKITNNNTPSIFALFREDSVLKHVYRYNLTTSNDYLYVDFSLVPGNTYTVITDVAAISTTVSVRDSLFINGSFHNRIRYSPNVSNPLSDYIVVEGILSTVDPMNYYKSIPDPAEVMTCQCHNNQPYYSDFEVNCGSSCSAFIGTSINFLSQKDFDISIYPNPAYSIINIVDNNNQLQNAIITITNILGEIVLLKPFSNQINITSLASGMYYITMQNGSNKKTIKITKQ